MFWLGLVCIFTFCQAEQIKKLPGASSKLKFVESQNNPKKDPIIFWFNGGPGCSSLDGLFNEMGPYFVNLDGKGLRENPHSWTEVAALGNCNFLQMASMVFIESPVGVGYSYSTDGNITSDDDRTSLENYEAIKLFFTGIVLGNAWLAANLFIDTSVRFAYAHGVIDEGAWNALEKECCGGCIDSCELSQKILGTGKV
ncbi:serine carboxypeptidase [Ostertagia ostertagi]